MNSSSYPYDRYDYEESELVVSIMLNSEGLFNCSWSDKYSLFDVWAEGETPKEVKRKFLEALPSQIDGTWFKFCFCDEIEEEKHEEIEKAIEIAVKKHRGQKTQEGKPYITHLWDVMCACIDYGDDFEIVAMLKDAHLSVEDLKEEGFSEPVIQAVDAITQREGEADEDYMKRVAKNPVAMRVKEISETENKENDIWQ